MPTEDGGVDIKLHPLLSSSLLLEEFVFSLKTGEIGSIYDKLGYEINKISEKAHIENVATLIKGGRDFLRGDT